MSQKKSVGFMFTLIAAALSLVACIVYTQVMYTLPVVFVFLVLAVLLEAGMIVMMKKQASNSNFTVAVSFMPILGAIFDAGAAGAGFYLMVNQLGYVVAGLDGVDTIITFIVFEVITLVAMIVNIVANFLPLQKEV